MSLHLLYNQIVKLLVKIMDMPLGVMCGLPVVAISPWPEDVFYLTLYENLILYKFYLSYQMFDISEEEFNSALGEIFSNSDNDVDLPGGMKHWNVHFV